MIIIRSMQKKDLEEVTALEKENFAEPWKMKDFEETLNNPQKLYIVAEENGILLGMSGAFMILEEAQISNVCVKKEVRQRHIAENMLLKLFELAREKGVQDFTLEVRKSNDPAIGLYQKLGFEVEGERRAFYTDPIEDALIMWKR